MKKSIDELLEIMANLRDPKLGCPWDIEQDFESLTTYTIEEAYEVADAIAQGDYAHLKEELGDLLFQIVFYSHMAKEQNLFEFKDVVKSLNKKMIKRHPHVFKDECKNVMNAEQQSQIWEKNKLINRQSVIDDIPKNLPGLHRAVKLTKRAAVIGFDWPNIDPVFDKMQEELLELQEAISGGKINRIKDELGDVLFVCANLARHLKIDPELAIRHANGKFESRFRAVEKKAKINQPRKTKFNLQELDALWNEVKMQES